MLILNYFIYVDVDKMLVFPLHTNLFKACTLCLIVFFFILFLFNNIYFYLKKNRQGKDIFCLHDALVLRCS